MHPQPSNTPAPDGAPPAGAMPLLVAAEVQDHLLAACNDLERLQVLLADAFGVLTGSFLGASQTLDRYRGQVDGGAAAALLAHAQAELGTAATALQFQDMGTQLLQHTHGRLRSCVDQLATGLLPDDEDGEAVVAQAPLRASPVAQCAMDVGSVELF